MALPKKIYRKVEKVKKEGKKGPEALNCQQRMAKTAQVLSNLNENLFNFFDLAVKNFCRSSLALRHGVKDTCGMPARSALGCVKTQEIEMTPLYIALLNRIIKKITLYMEATMTFDTVWHVTPLAGWRAH
jgi:hypothetical protein